MSGALAERVFAQKVIRVGFDDLQFLERSPFGLDQAAQFPLFTPDLIELMRKLIPAVRQDAIAVSVTVTARKPFDVVAPA